MSVALLIIWTLRFATEVLALLGMAWGAWVGIGGPLGIAVAVVAPVAAAIAWGLWVAPAARRRLPDPARLLVEVVVFVGAAWGYAAVATPAGGIAFGVVALALAALMRVPRFAEPAHR